MWLVFLNASDAIQGMQFSLLQTQQQKAELRPSLTAACKMVARGVSLCAVWTSHPMGEIGA
eukprot:1199918-Pleurochrysis_carterae.AAC.1